jgi:hypothetical protein
MGLERRLAASVDRLGGRLDKYAASARQPDAEIRQRVRDLAESQWPGPMVVVHLQEVRPEFSVPGRRRDGTVKGRRLIRRFFWNILRGVHVAVTNVILLAAGGGVGNVLSREGAVRGPENAQALGLVDAARPAKDPWLVYSDSLAAVIDSALLKILWHAQQPHAPKVHRARRLITWPDGSEFTYAVTTGEAEIFRQERKARLRGDGESLS